MARLSARVRRLTLAVVLVLVVLALGPARAVADSRTDFLIGRLKADDFRVRTNAALALGQTGDEAVVQPLCGALDDSSDVVRQAAASALERLAKASAASCLKDHLATETNDAVKRKITKALAAVSGTPGGGAAGNGPPRVVANAKYYVAFSTVSNQTGRADDDIAQVVLPSMRAKLDELGGFQVAPDKEAPEQARATMSKRKLKGYYLSIRVEKFDYSDGNLRVRLKVAVFTYPGKDLQGEVPAGVSQPGVRPGDTAAENNLLQIAAGNAIQSFVSNFQ